MAQVIRSPLAVAKPDTIGEEDRSRIVELGDHSSTRQLTVSVQVLRCSCKRIGIVLALCFYLANGIPFFYRSNLDGVMG